MKMQTALRKMNLAEYRRYSEFSFENFVKEAASASGQAPDAIKAKIGSLPPEPTSSDLWYVIDADGEDAGFIFIRLLADTGEAYGYDIFINEKLRGKGLGRRVLEEGKILLKSMGVSKLKICAFSENLAARALYASFGFKEISFRPESKQHELELEF
jgi:ribosomal protein S18 acetylase RimI-like enzyme